MVFWQNIPSIHQAPLIREVATLLDIPVYVFVAEDVPARRRRQGWVRPDFGRAQLIFPSTPGLREKILGGASKDTVHIFSGIHAYPFVYNALRTIVQSEATIGVFSEPQRSGGWKGLLRLARNRLNAKLYGQRIDFIIATGQLGVDWYRRSGFDAERLFPFAYIVDEPQLGYRAKSARGGESFQIVFVGQLIHRKGLDLLLEALAELEKSNWILHVVGDGRQRARYEDLARRLRLTGRIIWHGTLPNVEVRRLLAGVDCLVLPSRHDGWGAVVNEALMSGTPVLCTDACGASELLVTPEVGTVVRANSVDALRTGISTRLAFGKVSREQRTRVQRWAACIHPRAGAQYLIEIIKYVRKGRTGTRPVAPWRSGLGNDS